MREINHPEDMSDMHHHLLSAYVRWTMYQKKNPKILYFHFIELLL